MSDTDTQTEVKTSIHELEDRFVKSRNRHEWTCKCDGWSMYGGNKKIAEEGHKIHKNLPRNRGK